MCGIAGIVAGPDRTVDAGELARLSAAVAHRGPDDQGACAWTADGGIAVAPDCAALSSGARIGLAISRWSRPTAAMP